MQPEHGDRIEARRYVAVLSRSRFTIAAIVGLLTLIVLVWSSQLPDRYASTAEVVLQGGAATEGEADATLSQRRLSTAQQLITARRVMTEVSRLVPGRTAEQLERTVSASVDANADLISVTAEDEDAERAAQVANLVPRTFIRQQADEQRTRLERARDNLQLKLADAEQADGADPAAQVLRTRISELDAQVATVEPDLAIAEEAQLPQRPVSPRPVRNGILAAFVGVFASILFVLGRDLLNPRVSSLNDVTRLLGLPVLTVIPERVRRFPMGRRSPTPQENRAYQSLRAWVEFELSAGGSDVIVVTSAMDGEGKTTVTAGLAQAFAETGSDVLVITGDLHRTTSASMLTVEGPGLADYLRETARGGYGGNLHRYLHDAATGADKWPGSIKVLPAGTSPGDSAMSLDAIRGLLQAARRAGFDVVLVDAPPLLGTADATVLSQEADRVLLTVHLNMVGIEDLADLGHTLPRLPARPLGVVVIGETRDQYRYALSATEGALERRPA